MGPPDRRRPSVRWRDVHAPGCPNRRLRALARPDEPVRGSAEGRMPRSSPVVRVLVQRANSCSGSACCLTFWDRTRHNPPLGRGSFYTIVSVDVGRTPPLEVDVQSCEPEELIKITRQVGIVIEKPLEQRLTAVYGPAWMLGVNKRRRSEDKPPIESLSDPRACLAIFVHDPASDGFATDNLRRMARKILWLANKDVARRGDPGHCGQPARVPLPLSRPGPYSGPVLVRRSATGKRRTPRSATRTRRSLSFMSMPSGLAICSWRPKPVSVTGATIVTLPRRSFSSLRSRGG